MLIFFVCELYVKAIHTGGISCSFCYNVEQVNKRETAFFFKRAVMPGMLSLGLLTICYHNNSYFVKQNFIRDGQSYSLY
jgi:hypothetical protein